MQENISSSVIFAAERAVLLSKQWRPNVDYRQTLKLVRFPQVPVIYEMETPSSVAEIQISE